MKDRESPLVLAAAVIVADLWWHEYVSPKQATLDAAAECLYAQGRTLDSSPESRRVWGGCLKEAEAQHATKTLLAFGY